MNSQDSMSITSTTMSSGSTGSAAETMDQIRQQTEQLRIEAQVSRKKVSEVSKDLIEYCEKNKGGDTLVSGPADAHNPFQEKKSCTLV